MTSAYDEKVDAVAGLEEDIALAVQRTDAAEKRAQELADRVSLLEAELQSAELAAERRAVSHEETAAAGEGEVANESAGSVVETPADETERAALEAAHSEAVARLQSELEAIRAELQAEQEAHAARREEVAGAQAERNAAALELQNVQTQIAGLTDERDAGASEIARLSASLSEAQERADAEQQRAAELAESAVASENVAGPESASPVTADSQQLEALKAQMTRDADAHAAAIAEARETVRKWSDYSNALKQQLAQANEKMVVVLARGAGEATLSRRLAAELGQIKPEHELLRKEIQQQVVVETINAHLEKQGYRYDEKTGAVSKLNTETSPA
ncbi:chromosome segregation ATPase [Paraburkholderia sp. Clong3]|uniref:DNA-binding protein n=1 Tax=Paraburkholderia sp. Clong3 TaxID=2991061 RepID=UPI003D259A35